jgi:two-component system response regulator RpaA
MSKILIAEDQNDLREMMGLMLQMAGYQISQAPDGEAALAAAAEFQPDLIIMDMHMPGLTGCEVCAKLQNLEALQNIPVLLISGAANQDEIHAGFDAGVQEYLRKPFELSHLIQRVDAMLAA